MTPDFCDVRLSAAAAAAHETVTIATARFHYTFVPGTPVRVLTSEWDKVLSLEEVEGVKLFEIAPQAAS